MCRRVCICRSVQIFSANVALTGFLMGAVPEYFYIFHTIVSHSLPSITIPFLHTLIALPSNVLTLARWKWFSLVQHVAMNRTLFYFICIVYY